MLAQLAKILPIGFIEWYESWVLKKDERIEFFINHLDQKKINSIAEKKLLNIFKLAAKNVPAYIDFLREHGVDAAKIKSLETFNALAPQTTKENYVKKHSIEKRCVNGQLSKYGNIDEGAGSTGIPTNWVRSLEEEKILHKLFRFEFDYDLDGNKKSYIVLNTWSSGPWATGVKFCEIMQDYALVKNIGSDIDSTIRTLKLLGNGHNYIIAGYPPFLKRLVDLGKKAINWKKYKIDIITGGEGFIPEWRDYMRENLRQGSRIFSAYGSSDIDIGIAFENPFTIFIRELYRKNSSLRQKLFGSKEKMPMIFQYDPLQYYIRNVVGKRKDGTEVSEFEMTVLEKSAISPKIKYNIHDEGGFISFEDMVKVLHEHDPEFISKFDSMEHWRKSILRLPFLWINGRTDGTVSIDGANVYPLQVEMSINSDKELARKTNSFKLQIQNEKRGIRFSVLIELKESYKPKKSLEKDYHDVILKNLQKLNGDYKESYNGNKKSADPEIILFARSAGPFKAGIEPIKNKYII